MMAHSRQLRRLSLRIFQRVYQMDQRLRERLTPLGLWLAGVVFLSAVMGLNTRVNLASEIFSLLLMLFLLAALAGIGFHPHLQVERQLPRMATAGEPCTYRIRITNLAVRKTPTGLRFQDLPQLRFPSVEAFQAHRDPADQQRNAFDRWVGYPRWLGMVSKDRGVIAGAQPLPVLGPGQSIELSLRFTPQRRGQILFESVRFSHADPLGLVNAIYTVPLVGRFVVLPRRYPVAKLRLSGQRRYQPLGNRPVAHQADAEEFVGLRPYQPGDSLRRIHWKAWARVGTPVVREYQPEYLSRHALVLDTLGPAVAPALFEAAVSVAASLAPGLSRPDSQVDLVFVGDRVCRISGGPGATDIMGLLRILATVQASPCQPFERLSHPLLADDPPFAACCMVLLGWDQARAAMVSKLRQQGREVLALVVEESVRAQPAIPQVDYIPLAIGDLATALANIKMP